MFKKLDKSIDLSNIPKKDGKFDWGNSIGCKADFEYEGVVGEVIISGVDTKKESRKISFIYEDKEYTIHIKCFVDCSFRDILDKKYYTDEFKYEIGCEINELIILDRKRGEGKDKYRKYYKIKCLKCGFDSTKDECYKNGERIDWWILEDNFRKNIGCPCCCHSPRLVAKGINDLATLSPNLTVYFKDKEDCYKNNKSSSKVVDCKCPNCKNERKIRINDLSNKGFSCLKCSDGKSYPEKFVFNLLSQILKNNFEVQKSFNWSETKIYDFYVESLNLIIETHGGQHYEKSFYTIKKGRTLEEEQENDRLKEELALANGVEYYIVLDCRKSELEWIKSILINSKLAELFDLSNIDWNKCAEYSCGSLVKEVCDYWNNKEDWEMTTDLGKIFKLSSATIGTYLARGTELGWVKNYNPQEEALKGSSKSGKMNGKKVEVFKNGESLGVFPSCAELERQSKEVFGVILDHSCIAAVCNNKRKQHKGFTFKYINKKL